MNKAVLISIRPEYCEKIISKKKTVEIRKTKPKLETPFKCYIYESSGNQRVGNENFNVCLKGKGRKKVIGEFVCDYIIGHCEMANADIAEQQGCIKREKLFEYSNGKELYGWHISDLVIYEKPKELSEFYKLGNPLICDGRNCENCNHLKYMQVNSDEWDYDCDCQRQLENRIALKRPPQSWCYVEELV